MAISDDLFRAILAMDAYNRGYTPGIAGLGGQGTQIGNATISLQSNTPEQAAASFSATAYTWNNHQIISYRGTDVSSRCARDRFLKRVVGPGLRRDDGAGGLRHRC